MVIPAIASNTPPTSEREKKIVLVVDGDLARQFFTTVLLQRLKYHVFPVKTAEEAIMVLEFTMPLLIITEITLPQMNGIELLKNVKQDARFKDVPTIVYTAVKDPSMRAACVQAGCAVYLTQPADHNQMYEAVQKATEAAPRQFVRLATSLDVIVEGGPSSTGETKEQVTAISEHGVYISTPAPLPFGTTTTFTLFLDRARAWGIRVVGKVLYSHRAGDPGKHPGMGVKFEQIRPEDSEAIRIFIRTQLVEGIARAIKTSP